MRTVYGFYLRMLIEISLDISVICIVEVIMKETTHFSEKMSYWVSVVLLTILMQVLIYGFNVINENSSKIKLPEQFPEFHDKWGVLWEC